MTQRTSILSDSEPCLPAQSMSIRRLPRIVINRTQAAVLVTIFYSVTFLVADWGFHYIAIVRDHDMGRSELMTKFMGVFIAALCITSLVKILRSRR